MTMPRARRRLRYLLLLAMVLSAGLASRSSLRERLPEFAAAYAGDTLWALALFLGVAIVLRRSPTAVVAGLAVGLAVAMECSQLHQAPWLNRLRETTLGSLVLGFGFLWSDLVCYACGVLVGVAGEVLAARLAGDRQVA